MHKRSPWSKEQMDSDGWQCHLHSEENIWPSVKQKIVRLILCVMIEFLGPNKTEITVSSSMVNIFSSMFIAGLNTSHSLEPLQIIWECRKMHGHAFPFPSECSCEKMISPIFSQICWTQTSHMGEMLCQPLYSCATPITAQVGCQSAKCGMSQFG